MSRFPRRLLVPLLVVSLGSSAEAHEDTVTHIEGVEAVASPGRIDVTGQVTLVPPQGVVVDPLGDVTIAGIGGDIQRASVVADAVSRKLAFRLDIADPPQSSTGISEAVYYNWCFQATKPGSSDQRYFQVQAFRTAVGAPPGGSISVFRGREQVCNLGATGLVQVMTAPPPWSTLDGKFEDGAVEVTVPFDVIGLGQDWQIRFKDPPQLWVGSALGRSGLASFCGLNPNFKASCLDLVDLPPVTIAARSPLFVGVAPAGTPPAQVPMTAVADLDGSGRFTATLGTANLSPGEYVVAARICYDVCATGSTSITI